MLGEGRGGTHGWPQEMVPRTEGALQGDAWSPRCSIRHAGTVSTQLLGTTLTGAIIHDRVSFHNCAYFLCAWGDAEKARTARCKSSCPDVLTDVSRALNLPAWLPTLPSRPQFSFFPPPSATPTSRPARRSPPRFRPQLSSGASCRGPVRASSGTQHMGSLGSSWGAFPARRKIGWNVS